MLLWTDLQIFQTKPGSPKCR